MAEDRNRELKMRTVSCAFSLFSEPGLNTVAQTALVLVILLPQPSDYWHSEYAALSSDFFSRNSIEANSHS